MSGGVATIYKDSEPLFTGTHDGPDDSSYLQSLGAMFKSLGVIVGLAVENATKGTIGVAYKITDDRVEVSTVEAGSFPYSLPSVFGTGLTWDNGDTYNIYRTSTKDSTIYTTWTDVSAGFKAERGQLIDGWMPSDLDLDDHGKYKVFGPGFPE